MIRCPRAPLIDLPAEVAVRVEGMVTAADGVAVALRGALASVLAEGVVREAAREAFYTARQSAFEVRLAGLAEDAEAAVRGWLVDLERAALKIFDGHALPGLADRDTKDQAAIVAARRNLAGCLAGRGKAGGAVYLALGLPVPEKRKDMVA